MPDQRPRLDSSKRLRPLAVAVAMPAPARRPGLQYRPAMTISEMRWDKHGSGRGARQDRNNLISNNVARTKAPTCSTRATSSPTGSTCCRVRLRVQTDGRFRVSAAGWWDGVLATTAAPTPSLRQRGCPAIRDQKFSNYPNASTKGRPAEILDAFVFANFDLGDVASKVRPVVTRCSGASPVPQAARCMASRIRRCRSTCRRVSPRRASRPELFRPLGSPASSS